MKRVRSYSINNHDEPPTFSKTKSALSLGRTTPKRKNTVPETVIESGGNSPPSEASPGESKRDSGTFPKYGTVGRSMFGGVGKQWGSLFTIPSKNQGSSGASPKAAFPSCTINTEDYPRYGAPPLFLTVRVKPVVMDEIEEPEFHVSDSEEEETGAASFARKYNLDLEMGHSTGSPTLSRSETRSSPSTTKKSTPEQQEQQQQQSDQKTAEASGLEAKRTHIAKEIYTTEKSYVESLGVCIEQYQAVLLKKCAQFDESPEVVSAIFGNMNILYGFNKKLLGEIEKIVQTWNADSQLGATFFKLSPFLKMYTDYSNKYSEAMSLFSRLEKKNIKFKQIVDECYTASGHPCRVNDLLITPIQRIPRYSLLLSDLLRNTPESHPDHEQLKKSLHSIQEVANLVNEAVRRRENTMRLDEMQKEGYDLSHFIVSTRHLIKDGTTKVKVTKQAGPNGGEVKTVTEAQYWILFNDTFVRCKKEGAKHVDLRDYAVHLSLLWLQPSKKEVQLILPGEILTFSDDAWETELNTAINNFVALSDTIPKLRKYVPDSSEAPVADLRVGEYQDATGYYIGQWVLGKRNGKGKWVYRGNKYNGQWKDDKPHGIGRWTYHTGSVHIGHFVDGAPHGMGILKSADGTKLIGKFSRGIRKGPGKIIYSNGDVFQGVWKGDRIQGEGRLTCKNALVYVGEWSQNAFHGVGKLSLPTGVTYEGNFVRGRKQGRGCFKYPDETFYIGDVEDGMRHGKGKMFVSEDSWYEGDWEFDFPGGMGRKLFSGNLYEGGWSRGFRSGYGRMSYAGGIGDYEGNWENDKRHGEGVFVDLEGNSFSGMWQSDKLHGPATITYSNGGKFEGVFKDGMREKGKYTAGKGDCFLAYEGEWHRGLMHGKGALTSLDGTVYKGTFENGTLAGDCIVSNPNKGFSVHANFLNDFKDGKIALGFSSKADETLTGVLMSNTLMHASGLVLNVEPVIPLFGRRLEGEIPPPLTHF